ncbi:MAG: hypothetical protein KBC41_02345 [Candidatus Pacebacteria bacterium]|nr:hypothetical protein [Candidatus Paceibacterota bacterium]MBP9866895.1 hypothetical protein [Candidatus Paceibacterota bacterium]
MKKNVTILIGLVVVFVVLYAGNSFMGNDDTPKTLSVKDVEEVVGMKSFNGEVVRVFEGENILEYGFDIPETATTTVEMDGALIKVEDAGNPLITVYMSYEGGRGYTAIDYISNIIANHVPVIDVEETKTIGLLEWQTATSEGSEWYITSVLDGKWLIVVENKKTVHDTAEKILESVFAR